MGRWGNSSHFNRAEAEAKASMVYHGDIISKLDIIL